MLLEGSYCAKVTMLRSVPICDISMPICVPGERYLGGFIPAPTSILLLAVPIIELAASGITHLQVFQS